MNPNGSIAVDYKNKIYAYSPDFKTIFISDFNDNLLEKIIF